MVMGQLVIADKRAADDDMKSIGSETTELQGIETRNLNPEFRFAIPTAVTQITDGSTNFSQWTYTISFVVKVTSGYGTIADGTWEVYGTSTVDVISFAENPNRAIEEAESGSYGNGTDFDDLAAAGAFEIPPLVLGVPVVVVRLGDTIDFGGSAGFGPEWAIVNFAILVDTNTRRRKHAYRVQFVHWRKRSVGHPTR